jgi:hypothetical protein
MKKTRWFAILFFTIPYAVLFAVIILDARGVVSHNALVCFTMIALRALADLIPLGKIGMWVFTATVGLLCLWYIQRCYVKTEAPLRREGKHLLSDY